MKVTGSLLMWLHDEFRSGGHSYSSLAKQTEGLATRQAWSDLLQGRRPTIRDNMVEAICVAFNVSRVKLQCIADLKLGFTDTNVLQSIEYDRALALWRWVGYDKLRRDMIKAMGFDGDLPNDIHDGDVSKMSDEAKAATKAVDETMARRKAKKATKKRAKKRVAKSRAEVK